MGHELIGWHNWNVERVKYVAPVKDSSVHNGWKFIQIKHEINWNGFWSRIDCAAWSNFIVALVLNIQYAYFVLCLALSETPSLRFRTTISYKMQYFYCTHRLFTLLEIPWFNYRKSNTFLPPFLSMYQMYVFRLYYIQMFEFFKCCLSCWHIA